MSFTNWRASTLPGEVDLLWGILSGPESTGALWCANPQASDPLEVQTVPGHRQTHRYRQAHRDRRGGGAPTRLAGCLRFADDRCADRLIRPSPTSSRHKCPRGCAAARVERPSRRGSGAVTVRRSRAGPTCGPVQMVSQKPDPEGLRCLTRMTSSTRSRTSAVVSSARYRQPFSGGQVTSHVGQAVPDDRPHRTEVTRIAPALRQLDVGVFWVDSIRVVSVDPVPSFLH